MVLFGIALGLGAAVVAAAYVCYRIAFYAPRVEKVPTDEVELPEGAIYEVYREDFERWAREVRAKPREEMYITSFDGLKLHGRY